MKNYELTKQEQEILDMMFDVDTIKGLMLLKGITKDEIIDNMPPKLIREAVKHCSELRSRINNEKKFKER